MTTYHIGPIRTSLCRFWLWLYDMSHPSCFPCDQRERQIYNNTRTTYGSNHGITPWLTCLKVTTCHTGHTRKSLCGFRVWPSHQHHIYIISIPQVHHMSITTTWCRHHIYIIPTSYLHHTYTQITSYLYHINITSHLHHTSYLHHIDRISTTQLHRIYILLISHLHHINIMVTPYKHHINIITTSGLYHIDIIPTSYLHRTYTILTSCLLPSYHNHKHIISMSYW